MHPNEELKRCSQFNVYLSVATQNETRARASRLGVPLNVLVDVSLNIALKKVADETLALLIERRTRPARALAVGAPGLKLNERRVLAALSVLSIERKRALDEDAAKYDFPKPANPPPVAVACEDVAARAGLKLSACFWALRGLEAAGKVRAHIPPAGTLMGAEGSGVPPQSDDRWGRPLYSSWSLKVAP